MTGVSAIQVVQRYLRTEVPAGHFKTISKSRDSEATLSNSQIQRHSPVYCAYEDNPGEMQ